MNESNKLYLGSKKCSKRHELYNVNYLAVYLVVDRRILRAISLMIMDVLSKEQIRHLFFSDRNYLDFIVNL